MTAPVVTSVGVRGRLGGWLAAAPLLVWLALGVAVVGCRKLPGEAAAREAATANRVMSAGEVLKVRRSQLAIVEVTWKESTSILTGWRRRVRKGIGAIVSSDGQRALVLVSRRVVDPAYGRRGSIRTRDVVFRVSTPPERSAGRHRRACLVAVYMNAEDMALLRMGSPTGERFVMPVAGRGTMLAGDPITVVGPPGARGFAISTGAINNLWDNTRTGGRTLQISVAAGPASTAGIVFSHKGARLAGVLRSADPARAKSGVVFAVPAHLLCHGDYWDYLMEEGPTRRLLGMIH